ncbi:hypothetical protein L198_04729 [Cryptococcus wingfieldii CBS 7118]|uniref:Uncharacterized protein n=1 Tax=Cryptococcus wingfieldii CBS 7118 TaxID=1295528 RepID=A0A1E3J3A5_9TREE|nr:hypothetical protein L198_04729 [Cryptococcus wingfieldii CBS 7118]ODN95333.1 hypothetical protein L198_04729 [Cryptococcus wingfieldii CBS 7118]
MIEGLPKSSEEMEGIEFYRRVMLAEYQARRDKRMKEEELQTRVSHRPNDHMPRVWLHGHVVSMNVGQVNIFIGTGNALKGESPDVIRTKVTSTVRVAHYGEMEAFEKALLLQEYMETQMSKLTYELRKEAHAQGLIIFPSQMVSYLRDAATLIYRELEDYGLTYGFNLVISSKKSQFDRAVKQGGCQARADMEGIDTFDVYYVYRRLISDKEVHVGLAVNAVLLDSPCSPKRRFPTALKRGLAAVCARRRLAVRPVASRRKKQVI